MHLSYVPTFELEIKASVDSETMLLPKWVCNHCLKPFHFFNKGEKDYHYKLCGEIRQLCGEIVDIQKKLEDTSEQINNRDEQIAELMNKGNDAILKSIDDYQGEANDLHNVRIQIKLKLEQSDTVYRYAFIRAKASGLVRKSKLCAKVTKEDMKEKKKRQQQHQQQQQQQQQKQQKQ